MKKATETQIKMWKQQHGSIYEFEVELEEDKKAICYLKKPSIIGLAAASAFLEDKFKYLEILLNECWIDGDQAIKTDEEAKYTTMLYCDKLFQIKEATLKKL